MADFFPAGDQTTSMPNFVQDLEGQRRLPRDLSGQPTQLVPPDATLYQTAPPSTNYNSNIFTSNYKEVFKRLFKYLIEGLVVAFVAYFVTKGKLDWKEIIIIGVTAAFVFAILDTFSPTVALGTRFGAGFGIGQTMFGLNPSIMAVPAAI